MTQENFLVVKKDIETFEQTNLKCQHEEKKTDLSYYQKLYRFTFYESICLTQKNTLSFYNQLENKKNYKLIKLLETDNNEKKIEEKIQSLETEYYSTLSH